MLCWTRTADDFVSVEVTLTGTMTHPIERFQSGVSGLPFGGANKTLMMNFFSIVFLTQEFFSSLDQITLGMQSSGVKGLHFLHLTLVTQAGLEQNTFE